MLILSLLVLVSHHQQWPLSLSSLTLEAQGRLSQEPVCGPEKMMVFCCVDSSLPGPGNSEVHPCPDSSGEGIGSDTRKTEPALHP